MNLGMGEIARTLLLHERQRGLTYERFPCQDISSRVCPFAGSLYRASVVIWCRSMGCRTPEKRNGKTEVSSLIMAQYQSVISHCYWNEVSLKIKGQIDLVCQSTLLSGISFSYYHS
jgi:hypothetical protein